MNPRIATFGKAAVIFIFAVVLLDMLAFGMVIPVLPKLIEGFTDGDDARAAVIFGVFGTVWALMQFVFSPVLGTLSDRFGRRPVILVSCFGLGFDYVLMALAPTLAWLFVGRVISGITAASYSTAGAYIADITPPERRAANFGVIGVAFGIGFIAGPALGGILAQVDVRLPFWVAAGLSLANALYGAFVLPESLPRERRAAFSWIRANPVGALQLLRSHPELAGLTASSFLMNLAHVVLPSTAVLYMSYRYRWNEATVGIVLTAVGICALIVQGGAVKPAVARLGERKTLVTGLLFGATGMFIYGVASIGALFLIGIPLMALWGLAEPATQGLMTQRVRASEQGQLQGAKASVMGIANMIGPGLFTFSFASAIGPRADFQLPGMPFFIATALLLWAAFVAWRTTRLRSA